MTDTLFEQTGPDTFRATEFARGPWDPGALHGGPPSALVAGALEQAVAGTGVEFFPARFTAELLRPVPLDELTLRTEVRRPGRKVCVADATLSAPDGSVCVSATLAAIRRAPFHHQAPMVGLEQPEPHRKGWGATISAAGDQVMFARQGVEHRVVAGKFEDAGPATDWLRLTTAMVDDRPATAFERVVAVADFGNGISKWFEMEEVLFINPDLNVQLYRLPVSEWVCLDAVTRVGPEGVGLAESVLFDEDGPIGRATQSLLLEER